MVTKASYPRKHVLYHACRRTAFACTCHMYRLQKTTSTGRDRKKENSEQKRRLQCTLNYTFPRLLRVNDEFTSTTTGMGLLCSLRRLLEARSWLVFEVVELPPADLVGLVFRIELCQLRLGLRWQPCPQLRRDRGIASRMARGPGNLQGTGSLCFLFLFFDLDLKHWTWHRFELNAQLVDGVK